MTELSSPGAHHPDCTRLPAINAISAVLCGDKRHRLPPCVAHVISVSSSLIYVRVLKPAKYPALFTWRRVLEGACVRYYGAVSCEASSCGWCIDLTVGLYAYLDTYESTGGELYSEREFNCVTSPMRTSAKPLRSRNETTSLRSLTPIGATYVRMRLERSPNVRLPVYQMCLSPHTCLFAI